MKDNSTPYSKAESVVMDARSPEEYVDQSVRSRLPPRAKARLAKEWMKKTGFTVEDIVHARNRHPYWKQKKQENAAERARNRLARHSYSGGAEVGWSPELIAEFLDMNRKDKDGNYVYRDWQIAERFHATIPSIQYMRRKLIRLQAAARGEPINRNKLVESMKRSEVVLKKVEKGEVKLKDLGAKKPAAKKPAAKKVAAAKKPAAKKAVAKKPAAKKAVAKKPAAKKAVAKKPAAKKAVAKKPAAKKAVAKKPAVKKVVAKKSVAPAPAPTAPSIPAL